MRSVRRAKKEEEGKRKRGEKNRKKWRTQLIKPQLDRGSYLRELFLLENVLEE